MDRGRPFQTIAARSGWSYGQEGFLVPGSTGQMKLEEFQAFSDTIFAILTGIVESPEGLAPATLRSSLLHTSNTIRFSSETAEGGQLERLWRNWPKGPTERSEVTILISTAVCSECEEFARVVNDTLKLSIHLRHV
ncbi:hypothetical protein MPH_03963 [Macrophomina phaseolina MS6]|uniref:Uncharacterized protein n=1 Tax=Macrophomina phaseolina (strain MS6) TaxID=1126212 RepID=K2S196_MACPH|nr:hypothetical protein MPH_03963 [Macrophomina phaseolina MS6]